MSSHLNPPSSGSAPVPNGNLVVVQAGDSSLHPTWTQGPVAAQFDLVVSYFGDDPEIYQSPNATRHDFKGGKWDGIENLFTNRPELFDRYRYIWAPDDDLACDTATINRLFAAMREHNLQLGQPGLTLNSYHSYLGYLRSRTFLLRYVDTIEVMAPCFSTDLLRKILPVAATVRSGWGLDPVWTRFNENNYRTSAILDGCLVHHTRPVGGPMYSNLKKIGHSPSQDAETMRLRFGQTRLYPLVYEAIDKKGRIWRSKLLIALRLWLDLLIEARQIPHLSSKKSISKILRRQLKAKIDLSSVNQSN